MSTEGQIQTRPEIARVRTCLASSVHFRALQADDLDCLASSSRVYRLRDGQPLYKADGAVDALWIVLSGSLRISSIGDDKEYVYALLGPGSFFGLGFILGGHQGLSVGASAYGATDVAAIDGSRFLQLLDQRPHLWRHFAGVVVRRLSLAMLAMRDISSTSLRERIVRRLLGQAISGGADLAGSPVELRITQSDLAAMLGASRTKVNAELKALENERLIKVGYRIVTLTNLARLRELAGPDVFAL